MFPMRAKPLFATILLLSACGSTQAPVPVAAPLPPATLAAPDILTLLPPAPAANSVVDKADVAALLDLQAKRTQSMCDFAQGDVEVSLKRFLAPLGLTLNGDTMQTEQLFKLMAAPVRDASDVAKTRYKRPRPYDYDARLIPCISKVPGVSYSYPSGHAAIGYVLAALFTQIVPEQQAKWYGRAADFARSRMVGGVHFPSDIETGKMMGLLAAERALRDPAVHAQLELARPELRRALGY
jgi:acid phosphatase (class A)